MTDKLYDRQAARQANNVAGCLVWQGSVRIRSGQGWDPGDLRAHPRSLQTDERSLRPGTNILVVVRRECCGHIQNEKSMFE